MVRSPHFFRCFLFKCVLFSSVVKSTIDCRKISWAQFENEVKDWGWANGGIKKIFQHLDRHMAYGAPFGGAGNGQNTFFLINGEWHGSVWKERGGKEKAMVWDLCFLFAKIS